MTQICFSTVIRAGKLDKAGEFARLDWDRKQVLASVPAAPIEVDLDGPNPRGGGRGGRGITSTQSQIFAVDYDKVHIFDHDLNGGRTVSNGLLVGLHEVYLTDPRRLWVAATSIDAALEVDVESGACTRAYWPREDPRLQESLGLTPLVIDKSADNRSVSRWLDTNNDPSHLHLNALAMWNGDLHALFNRRGVVVNLERGEVVVRHPLLVGGHNLVVVGDDVYVSATKNHRVCQYDLRSGRLVRSIALEDLDWVRSRIMPRATRTSVAQRMRTRLAHYLRKRPRGPQPNPVAKPMFVRGLQVVEDYLFVGLSPASILSIDWPRGQLVDAFQYSTDVKVAIHGLHIMAAATPSRASRAERGAGDSRVV